MPASSAKSARSGCVAQLVQFRIRQFVKREIIGDLYHGNVRFDRLFEQTHATERPLRQRVPMHTDRPWQAPGCDSEFCTFDFGQHEGKILGRG